MKAKTVIFSSGGSQLLTQIATLTWLGQSLDGIPVIYIGVSSSPLVVCLKNICSSFGLSFNGCIDNIPDPQKIVVQDLARPRILQQKIRSNRKIQDLENLHIQKKGTLLIPFREKMLGDVLLVNYLRPKKLILTSDGVIHNPKKRDIKNWQYLGKDRGINRIPINKKIYTPSYLLSDTNKIGDGVKIPEAILYSTFDKASQNPFFYKYLTMIQELKPKAILFLQHLSLNGNCTLEEEIRYYTDIVDEILHENVDSILIKPHPRDTIIKIERLKDSLESFGSKITWFDKNFNSVPVELFREQIIKNKTNLITASSSACLSVKSDQNDIINFTATYLNRNFLNEIENFSSRYSTILKRM